MGRLIDADALIETTEHLAQVCFGQGQCYCERTKFQQLIKKQPTVDAVPVRHAFWYWDKDGMDWNIGAWRCSACHNRPNTMWETEKNPRPRMWSGSAYCSNCGAVMDGKENADEVQ